MKVHITEQDFEEAKYHSSNCPLAKTLKRKFPNNTISVGGFTVDIGSKRYDIEEPGELCDMCKLTGKRNLTVTLTQTS